MSNPGPAITATANTLYGGNASGGSIVGSSATALVSFFGATAVAQQVAPAVITTATLVTTGATTTTPYGYATAAQADALVTIVNDLRVQANVTRTALVNLGLAA